ncbi:hypothetical protein AB9M62_08990 [Bacillales bacterium AN1005]
MAPFTIMDIKLLCGVTAFKQGEAYNESGRVTASLPVRIKGIMKRWFAARSVIKSPLTLMRWGRL